MSSEIISTIFRFLNFGVTCGVGVYVFKKYLLPDFKGKIAEQRAALQSMAQRNQELLDQKNAVTREISEQEELGRTLYDQIKLWSFSFAQERARRDSEQKVLTQQVEHRAQVQAQNKMHSKLQKFVLEQALAGARQDLAVRFSSEQEGRRFLASIVACMREDMR